MAFTHSELQDLDLKIRSGQVRLARRVLEQRLQALRASRAPLPRPLGLEIAALCRRTGLSHESVRLLCPVVRPKARAVTQATDAEKGEYAAALIQIGADVEGLKLLSTIDATRYPRAQLFEALAHFSRWDYTRALAPLERYVAAPQLSDYERLIGQVNLAAAQVATRSPAPRLPELLTRTRDENLQLLHTNLLEIQAQAWISEEKRDEATQALEEASRTLREIGSTDALFVRKWKAVLDRDLATLRAVREDALRAGHWETVRDCDFHLRSDLAHLYFGTPYEAYREKIRRELNYAPPAQYEWAIAADATRRVDPQTVPGLKPGQIPQRLLLALARDFYKPQRLASLHAALFPDRFYNPLSSPAVVHQAIKRLRHWTTTHSLPLRIREHNGSYQLEGKIILHLKIQETSTDPSRAKLDTFLNALQRELDRASWFSHADAMRVSAHSSRSTHRLLRDAVNTNRIIRSGSGKSTHYRFSFCGK